MVYLLSKQSPLVAGKRNDLDAVKVMIDAGSSMLSIADTNFGTFIRHHRGLQAYAYLRHQSLSRDWKTQVVVYYGPTRSGKSMHVKELAPDAYWVTSPKSGGMVYWDGYDGQDDVVIDDFYGWLAFNFMLRLCDRYPFQVPTHHGQVNFLARRVFITSNHPPDRWYTTVSAYRLEAMLQRIEHSFEVPYSQVCPCPKCSTWPCSCVIPLLLHPSADLSYVSDGLVRYSE